MNLDSLSFAQFQITNSVSNLSKRTYKSYTSEILNLVNEFGEEAEKHLIRCLFSFIDFSSDTRATGKDAYQIQFLNQEFTALICKPHFTSLVCFAIDNPLSQQKSLKPTNHLLHQLSKTLKLSAVQDIALGLALQHSASPDIRKFSTQFLKQKLLQLINALVETESRNSASIEGSIRDAPTELLHQICFQLQSESFRESVGISVDQKDLFFQALKRGYPQSLVPVVLAPYLTTFTFDLSIDNNSLCFELIPAAMITSLVDTLHEIGYNFSKSKEQCRNALVQFGVKNINPTAVAKVLGFMARVPAGFVDPLTGQNPFVGNSANWPEGGKDGLTGKQDQANSWNVEIFVQTVKELAPTFPWKDTVKELDHPGFYVSNKSGFENLIKGLFLTNETFPIEFLYTPWKNKEGQISWISSALKYPDVFCFANFPYTPVDVSCLKNPPDDKLRDVATWKSLDLIKVLLLISDDGLQNQVHELIKFPMTQCPDLFLVGVLQANCWNSLKQEVISGLLPVFLGQHNNAVSVLTFTWHIQGGQNPNIRALVLRAMSDWYLRDPSDNMRLARILDMAQDLKALSTLLNAPPNPFVIDLACLASRREYLKLDKWVNDKIREHGEPFIEECSNFVIARITQPGLSKEEAAIAAAKSVPPVVDTHNFTILLNCIQNFLATNRNISPSAQENVARMAQLLKQKHPQTGMGANRIAAGTTVMTPVSIAASQSDHLSGLNNLSYNAFALNPSQTINPHAQFQRALPPGSPAKGFNILGGGQQPFSNTQLYNSTVQGLNVHNSLANGYGGHSIMSSQLSGSQGLGNGLGNHNLNPALATSLLGGTTVMGGSLSGMHTNVGAPSLGTLSAQAALNNQRPGTSTGTINELVAGMGSHSYSKDVEDEANSYFKRIFNTASSQPGVVPLTVDELLELMRKFRSSLNPREKEVYSCMIRNLFEEYKFFNQYPDKELITTANLFGGLIEYDLVNSTTSILALRCILEALKKRPGNNMYLFGLTAIERFRTKLKDHSQFCGVLAALPNFPELNASLREYISYGAQAMDVPHSTSTQNFQNMMSDSLALAIQSSSLSVTASNHGAIRPPNSSYSRNSIANATNIDTLLANKEGIGDVAVPSESLQDKIFFIFNNLSQANMDQKANEMIEQVGIEYMDWVAQYLVMRRASIEPNFHTLYLNFVDQLPKPGFQDRVISETYRNIKVLLRSDKGCSNFSDRTLLKNLGHWLGMLMLAKNKPILQLELDLKALIYEAYMKGPEDLLYVVPFVAKVLESAGKSRVFRPPNPWTMAIMNVLAELHGEPELKLNLKFEIEVLCKNLQIDINDLEPAQYLKDPVRLQSIVIQLSPNKQNKVENAVSSQEESQVELNVPMPGPPAVVNQTHPQPAAAVATTGVANMEAATLQQYGYQDLPSMTPSVFSHNIVINDQGVTLFHQHPQLKQCVKPAIERAVQELLSPAIDRAVNIALKTSEIIIKKDFALEPDENKMRVAAHNFVRFMTAGMALITCHEPVLISIANNLKTMLASALRIPSPQQKELIDVAAQMVAQDNAELATVFLQKTAIERALPEIDKRLAADYEARRMARSEGRPYYDQTAYLNQERLPEKIRLKLGGVSPNQLSVYEEFTRNVPGFLPPFAEHGLQAMHPHFKNLQALGADDVVQTYDKIARDLEQNLGLLNGSPLQALLQQLLDHVLQCRTAVRDINCAIALLQRAVEGLMEGLLMASIPGAPETPEQATRFRDCHLLVLKFLQDHRVYGPQWTNKQVTRCLLECREELRYSFDAVQALLQNQLVVISQYDHILASLIEGNSGYLAIPFAMQIIQRFCIESEKHTELRLLDGEFVSTIDALQRAALHSRGPETLAPLLEMLRQQTTETGLIDRSIMGAASSMMNSGIAQANEFNDPPGFQEKAEFLIREWVNTYHTVANNRDIKPFNHFINQMWFQGVLKTDDLITRFFRVSTECCVNICYRVLTEPNHNPSRIRFQCFNTLDAFVRLIVLLLKHSGDHSNNNTKINLLNKVLGVVTGVLLHDHEAKRTDFHPLPYHRIFIMLFIELNAPDPIFESLNIEVLTAFANAMHNLRPAKAASFSFAWIEIISHRVFIGKMLALNRNHKTWGMYAQLIVDLFAFQAPYLRNADLPKAIQQMYKGTMRVFLLLLHDFPELLVEYHCALCDVIPTNCIQIRNLVLSAYPKNMRLPDPFTPNLRVEMLPDINQPPKVSINYVANIQPLSFKKDLDSYLKTRSPVTFLSDLRGRLQLSNNPGMKYNIPLLNSLVLHVGSQAIAHIHSKGLTPSVSTIAHSSHMDIFQNLAVDLDTEGRYLFLNAMVNHLRYPNSHTQYFSSSILYLFAEANTEAIQEQIMRVLLERLIVNRPHPWGLLVTFIELIKNPQYKFWTHDFVHCAPEIDRLLDSVARSCMLGKVISRDVESVDVR